MEYKIYILKHLNEMGGANEKLPRAKDLSFAQKAWRANGKIENQKKKT